ncbi:MAG: glycine oxidase ThiO [Vulcanimicrobiaceae bacterium]
MIVVIGAGLVGLTIAYELAKRGATVRVLEAGESAKSASWAGAGRLAPFTESEGDEELELFLATALGVYQVFVKELHKRTGVDPYLRVDGIVQLAYDEDEAARLQQRAEALISRGIHTHWLDGDEVRRIEPWVGTNAIGASVIEDEGQIDNRQLGAALRMACTDAGAQIEENTGPVALVADERKVLGVQAGGNFVDAETVVNAAGALAGKLDGVPAHVQVEIEPVKGQLIVLSTPERRVNRLIYAPGAYLIPRFDGTLVVGETEQGTTFDPSVDPFATRRLREAALRAIPALVEAPVLQSWVGFRPRSPNGRPYIGTTPLEGYFVAAGHYRNGILLAPATALAIANVIEGTTSHA